MGDKSAIEWTDATWNPVTGCSKVSPGCAHCYAETLALKRLAGKPGYPGLPWTPENAAENVVLRPERLKQPLRWREPRMVFVNSMSDLFHPRLTGLPDEDPIGRTYPRGEGEPPRPDFIARVFAVMSLAERHTFQVLTKRPKAMALLLGHANFWLQVNADRMGWGYPVIPGGMSDLAAGRQTLPNVWLGTSIENRQVVERADWLRVAPAAVRFVSAEPLLGPLDDLILGPKPWPGEDNEPPPVDAGIDAVLAHRPTPPMPGIDWLIVGGESGPGHRPMRAEWVRDLRDSAQASDVAFFFKQWGGHTPKAGGRELDERTWDEMPAIAGADLRRSADSGSHQPRLSDGVLA